MTSKAVARWFEEMPREEEMLPKDKYTIFDRKEKKYRKGIHSTFHGVLFFSFHDFSRHNRFETIDCTL